MKDLRIVISPLLGEMACQVPSVTFTGIGFSGKAYFKQSRAGPLTNIRRRSQYPPSENDRIPDIKCNYDALLENISYI